MRKLQVVSLLIAFTSFLLIVNASPVMAQAQVRIKDIAHMSGMREYQLIGYGLVTGLGGTGDKTLMSIEMVRGMLQNMGMEVDKSMVQSKNCAAVVVTAMLPPFGKMGESFDVTVSSIGDSSSLQGGVLLPVLLKGGDGQVYAVSQGAVSIGGVGPAGGATGGGAGGAIKSHLTVARVPKGAILEREVGEKFGSDGSFYLMLERKDLTMSRRVKEAVDRKYGDTWAHIDEPGSVKVTIPRSFRDDPVTFAASIEDLTLLVEDPNRVVINERTGTVIVGSKVRISPVTISQGGLRIDVAPAPGAAATQKKGGAGAGAATPTQGSLINLSGETTVDDLVKALNAVGATPKDLISIFQAVDAAGALHGELKIM
ncbi:MAG: flagellar basal body P-ring protein FlgI [Candidatus Riflebacteria bacterium]|nr:flagellar basal body P-ring protein FlgI [Candidatus Riflebacteria bacterium]